MKKFLPTLLIAIILVNMFAPFTVRVDAPRGIRVEQNIASAEENTGPSEEQKQAIAAAKAEYEAALALFEEARLKKNLDGSDFYTAEQLNDFVIAVQNAEKKLRELRTAAGLYNEEQKDNSEVVPTCNPFTGKIVGCIAIIFDLIFTLTSKLLGITGMFFDTMFAFSVNDDSYRSSFVVEGWGLMRDIVNMFFIFVLLYVAFATILNIHGNKPKDLIVNVVIIGLLINFSLFATQVIIDTSNILARVFYNSETISISKDGKNVDTENGKAIPMSEVIVSKINPQKLIFEGLDKAGTIGKTSEVDATMSRDNLTETNKGAGVYILVVSLAIVVNVVGIIVFLTVGLLFVARVIGLWLAMILVPLAFFSYTVPQMKSMDMVGWERWWPDTLKMAFLAPIFMFFMYLIIKFLSFSSLVPINEEDGATFILATMIPFIFIMVLMWQAKSIASKLAGTIGSTVTNAGMALGGLALGGAALGTAFVGRQALGKTMAWMSQGDNSKFHGEQRVAFNQKLQEWKANGKNGAKPKWEDHIKNATVEINGKNYFENKKGQIVEYKDNVRTRIGGLLNSKQKQIGDVDHARHEMDSAMEKAGFKDKEFSSLSGVQQQKVQDIFIKENKSKWSQEVEDKFRKDRGYNDKQALSPDEITDLRRSVNERAAHEFEHEMEKAAKKVNAFSRAFSNINTGTMDVRNLSQLNTDKRAGWITKLGVGAMAKIALAVRSGLKSGLSINHGVGQGDLLKDLSHTIENALKGMKIDVKLDGGGGGHAKADHGGGHGGGGHH